MGNSVALMKAVLEGMHSVSQLALNEIIFESECLKSSHSLVTVWIVSRFLSVLRKKTPCATATALMFFNWIVAKSISQIQKVTNARQTL